METQEEWKPAIWLSFMENGPSLIMCLVKNGEILNVRPITTEEKRLLKKKLQEGLRYSENETISFPNVKKPKHFLTLLEPVVSQAYIDEHTAWKISNGWAFN
ncbi:MAG: hypothetical protein WCG28_04690 [bacterium]